MPPAAAKERSPRDVLVSVRSIERPDGSSKFVVDVKDDARGAGKLAASLSGASDGGSSNTFGDQQLSVDSRAASSGMAGCSRRRTGGSRARPPPLRG